MILRHSADHRSPEKEPTAFPVQGSYAAMFAGMIAAGTRQGSGRYAVTHRTKIIAQKSIHLSEKTLIWLHG
jgi:hypothetical protein